MTHWRCQFFNSKAYLLPLQNPMHMTCCEHQSECSRHVMRGSIRSFLSIYPNLSCIVDFIWKQVNMILENKFVLCIWFFIKSILSRCTKCFLETTPTLMCLRPRGSPLFIQDLFVRIIGRSQIDGDWAEFRAFSALSSIWSILGCLGICTTSHNNEL